jgi:hypothetical protein
MTTSLSSGDLKSWNSWEIHRQQRDTIYNQVYEQTNIDVGNTCNKARKQASLLVPINWNQVVTSGQLHYLSTNSHASLFLLSFARQESQDRWTIAMACALIMDGWMVKNTYRMTCTNRMHSYKKLCTSMPLSNMHFSFKKLYCAH